MNPKTLYESYIASFQGPTLPGQPPIVPAERDVPIIATERWREVNGRLVKSYKFMDQVSKAEFVIALLEYEAETQHNADINIKFDTVDLNVGTRDIDRPTEIDREYAKFADVAYRDTYSMKL